MSACKDGEGKTESRRLDTVGAGFLLCDEMLLFLAETGHVLILRTSLALGLLLARLTIIRLQQCLHIAS